MFWNEALSGVKVQGKEYEEVLRKMRNTNVRNGAVYSLGFSLNSQTNEEEIVRTSMSIFFLFCS